MNSARMYTITGGLYLVVDPAPGAGIVLPAVQAALNGGVAAIQVWNHWAEGQNKVAFIHQLCLLGHSYNVPVIMNDDWQLLLSCDLDGVHFDTIPLEWGTIRETISRPFITGITCGNMPEPIDWAIENKIDYLSFCSVFPSASAMSCELVSPLVIQQTRAKTSMPIFAAGGVTPDTIPLLSQLGINGVAVISAIMKADDPEAAARKFTAVLQHINT